MAPPDGERGRRGDIGRFRGDETIRHRGQLVYTAWVGGGLADQRRGD